MLRPADPVSTGIPLQATAPGPESLAVDVPFPDLPFPRSGAGTRDLVDEWAAPPSVRCPSPGPGGTLAFVGDRTGPPALWIRGADGGERVVDTGPGQVRSVMWSPDGAWIAVVVAPGGGERTEVRVLRPDGTGLRTLAGAGAAGSGGPNPTDPVAATAVRWLAGGTALLVTEAGRSGLTHALAVELSGRRRHLAAGLALQVCAVHEAAGRWRLLLREGPRGARRALVTQIDVQPADVPPVDVQPVDVLPADAVAAGSAVPGGTVTALAGTFLADGSRVLIACDLGRERPGLLEVPLDADATPGPARLLAGRDDADLERLVLVDPATAVLSWNAGGRSELALCDLATGASRPLPPPPGEVVTGLLSVADGATLMLALAGLTALGEVWTFDLAGARADGEPAYRCLVSHTPTAYPTVDLAAVDLAAVDLAAVDLATVDLAVVGAAADRAPAGPPAQPVGYRLVRPVGLRFHAHDGLELSGWWYRPPAGPGPLPTLVYFHGGPEAQERPVLNPLFHALLAQGIAVFAPNVRGSTGFGRSFEEADHGEHRFAGITDAASAVRHLVDEGLAAPGRIGVAGRSYGGYLTLAALVTFPDLFAVGVDVCGMVDLETFYQHTEPWIGAPAVVKYGDPVADRELLRALSPLHRMDALAAPLMVVHGANDTNVPLFEAEQTVAAARARGVPCEYLLFEGEGHEVAERANRLAFVRGVAGFVSAHLTGAGAAESLGEAV
ncbi:S9 family peptidase [Parafrankia elaeagni]|uniref:S9 family peptidase n=1 Tax=Parafrankia elaeagni TaxID=222534 RepID=UPI0003651861|nr:prolyl oligopeptidase family serine peptidase [Parafrankia elaeagni]